LWEGNHQAILLNGPLTEYPRDSITVTHATKDVKKKSGEDTYDDIQLRFTDSTRHDQRHEQLILLNF
jgi:hypothetical protein